MADEKPTSDTRAVPLDLSIERRLILRSEIETWRNGIQEDLEDPSKLKDPDRTRRLGAAYQRLIEALRQGTIELPDEEACAAFRQAADGFDDAEKWEETRTIHDAQRTLLAVLCQGKSADCRPWTTTDEDLAMESAVLQRVLDFHPARLTRSELRREIAGEEADFGARDDVDRATRDLSGVGLLHTIDGFVTPTRAALRFQELSEGRAD